MPFGFDSTLGYVSPTYEEVLDDLVAKYLAESGILVNTDIPSPTSDTLRTMARIMKAAYDDGAGVYGSAFVATSSGAALRNLLLPFIGSPLVAVASSVVVTLSGVAATVIPAGSSITLDSDGPGAQPWTLDAQVIIGGGGTVDGTFSYSITGPKPAESASDWTITTPVAGWASAGPNAADADLGRNAETELEYRQRFTISMQARQLVAQVSAVDGVTSVGIFENQTGIPDAYWGETHWSELLVVGGTDQAIGEAIHTYRAITTRSIGSTSVVVADAAYVAGSTTEEFSRPNEVDVWIELTITQGEGYSSDTSTGASVARETAIKDRLVAWGALRPIGLDLTSFQAAVIAASTPTVPGIANIVATVGLVDPPVDATVVAGVRDLLIIEASRINIIGA